MANTYINSDRVLDAYLGSQPVLDGIISPGEYDDAAVELIENGAGHPADGRPVTFGELLEPGLGRGVVRP